MDTEQNMITAKKLLSEALAVDSAMLPDDARITSLSSWDSMAHMRLIMAMESYLGKELDAEVMISIACLDDIAKALD